MESAKRKIKDGGEYDYLFPAPSGKDTTTKRQASVEDTMELIQQTVPKTLWHTEKIAKKLRGRTLDETCSNIWHFVYDHIQYKRDKDGVEQVRSPRRTWWERAEGVDCDCYTEFISSILLNLNIPHVARITKYPKRLPEIPRWQHVYPIVPRDDRGDKPYRQRDDYIVIDCVKDEYDDEQPFLESKDYSMRLDYLDGLDDQARDETNFGAYSNVDASDLSALYDGEELGRGGFFKKLGNKIKEGVRFINRFTNPGTIMLRNGFLLAMKTNLFNVAGRIRYAYLSDAQAKTLGMNLDALNKLRHIKDRAETIYYQAGGKKENLKRAILHGKGNKDKKIPLSGLYGLDDVYADVDEYNIIHDEFNELWGLQENDELGFVAAASVASATSVIAALAATLKQVKGLFHKDNGGGDGATQSPTDSSVPDDSTQTSASSKVSEGGGAAPQKQDDTQASDQSSQASDFMPVKAQSSSSGSSSKRTLTQNLLTADTNETPDSTKTPSRVSTHGESVLPDTPPGGGVSFDPLDAKTKSTSLQTMDKDNAGVQKTPSATSPGFVQKTTTWIKDNPGKTLLIASTVVTASVLLIKSMHKQKSQNNNQTLSGLPKRRKKSKPKSKHKMKSIKL